MDTRALISGVGLGAAVLLVMTLLRTLQEVVQSVLSIGIVLIAVYVGYEIMKGWTA